MKIVATLLLCVSTPFLFAQNYSLDPAYGTNGVLSINVGTGTADLAQCGTRDQNGNYYIAGYAYGSSTDFGFSKVLANGQLDASFGTGGSFAFGFTPYTLELINSIAVQADGKIVFAGELYQNSTKLDAIVGRLLPNGSLDLSFNSTGYYIYNGTNLSDSYQSVAVQSDGKIVVAGYQEYAQYHAHSVVCRFNADGSLDNTFATNGVYLSPLETQSLKMHLDNSGNIVIAGIEGSTSNYRFMMQRLSSGGILDTSFGNSGLFNTSPCVTSNAISDFTVLPSGDFLCIGIALNGNPVLVDDTTFLFHVNNNGTLNTSYYNQGYLRINKPGYDVDLISLRVRNDGSCLIAGTTTSSATADRGGAFCEISAAGVLNTSIGTGGIVEYNPTTGYENFRAIYEEGNSVVCLGWQNNPNDADYIITKYAPGSALNTVSFAENDLELYPNPADDLITIKTSNVISRAKIHSLEGKEVRNLPVNETSQSFNLGDLSPGQYLVTFYNTEGQQVSHVKIIKN